MLEQAAHAGLPSPPSKAHAGYENNCTELLHELGRVAVERDEAGLKGMSL